MAIHFDGDNNTGFYKLTYSVMDVLGQSDNADANVLYFDLDRIIYTYKETEYIIRMWNITADGNVDFTVYEVADNTAKDIYNGYFVYNSV